MGSLYSVPSNSDDVSPWVVSSVLIMYKILGRVIIYPEQWL